MAAAKDTILVDRVKAGDQKSFRELVEKYQARVYSIILGMVGDKNEADDLAQEVFLRVYRFLHTFKGKSQFYTWLYRITMNTCINAKNGHRRMKPSVSLSQEIDEKGTPLSSILPSENPGEAPFKKLENKELAMQLEAAVELLPNELKQAFILREVDDLSYKEMSRILDCPQGTVKSRLYRARELLKQTLRSYLDVLEES